MGAGQASLCCEEGKILLDTWVESGWFEYLRNWDYVDCYCMFMCGTQFLGKRKRRSYKGDKWKNGEMVEGAHGEGKGKSRRKNGASWRPECLRRRFHFGKPLLPLLTESRFSC